MVTTQKIIFGVHLKIKWYRAFSHDLMVAILVFQNNEIVAMLVFQTNPVAFFCSNKFA